MEIKILQAQKSTKNYDYELVVHVYAYENADIPLRTIDVEKEYYAQNVNRYGMEALLKGVELTSMLTVTEKVSGDLFEKEAEAIAYSIVARMEKETFFNNYNPNNMREYIEKKLNELKTKFKIEPK